MLIFCNYYSKFEDKEGNKDTKKNIINEEEYSEEYNNDNYNISIFLGLIGVLALTDIGYSQYSYIVYCNKKTLEESKANKNIFFIA